MLNERNVEAPPPGVGLRMKTLTAPVLLTSPAGIAAVTCVASTKVVTRGWPAKYTVEPDMKFVPFAVSVNAVLFTGADDGETDEIVGRGLTGPVKTASKTDIVFCWLFIVAKPGRPAARFWPPANGNEPVAIDPGCPPPAKSR